MKINMHERIPMKRECEVYRVNYSYLTQRKNKRTSSCDGICIQGLLQEKES